MGGGQRRRRAELRAASLGAPARASAVVGLDVLANKGVLLVRLR